MRRYVFPLIFGIVGVAILLSLGTWQMRRLAWKEDILAAIQDKISAAPVPLSGLSSLDPEADRYLPVQTKRSYRAMICWS